MDNQSYYFPRYLNEPLRFFIFTIDELIFFLAPIFIGFLVNWLLCGILFGSLSIMGLRTLKNKTKGYQFLVAFLYWHLPLLSPCRCFPNAYEREFLG